ncbi:PD40 domain-containing protein [Hymenobacter sp. PAMC 26628]|uniref:PD40 domain-containing protein n=1 Tax=Hymenobacter sp. PAMC 26628 TaxID=1484118 RepID=UPI0007700CC4|nr:PD40 domain-containing protein [Hymenobacter sp. PAMC 26628]AMJ64525.1 hypothetical protein AXW84_03110 [Hymenobacter sp. PAMC 26628]
MTNITLVGKAVRGVCALVFLVAAGAPARAQTAQEQFGRVRIQYHDFHWQQYTTQNFTVMYYDGNEPAARRAVDYAEKELQRVTALIGYYPYAKTTIMLYNSVGDLRQSNVGLDPNPETVAGGDAPLARMSKVQIAFTGLQTDYKREISFQLTQVLLNDMMYGGSLREVLQSSYLLQLPDWFISGAAAYAAEGWSVDMDGYMRDMTRLYPSGNRSAPFFIRDARLSGHSVWNYIAERYGYTSIQNILNLTRITRDAEVGISSSLNVPYKIFMRDWLAYYRALNAQPATAALALPDAKFQVGGRNRRATIYSQPVFSPNGQQLAYAVNELGRYRVVVARRDGSHRNTVGRGGYKTPDQQVENRLPVLAWRGNTQVAVAEMAQGTMTLHLRDATGNNTLDRLRSIVTFRRPASLFNTYDQVLSMNYSADGKSLAFSAVRGGQNDLYVLRAGSRQAEQLTNDLFDDAQPVFMPDGKSIAFSSNRYLDSLGPSRPATFANVVNNYDLFLYHLDGRTLPVEVLASTISNETRPRALSDDQLLYLGEESGVRSLYRYTLSTKQRDRLTSFLPNISDFDYSPTTTALAMVAPAQARDVLYTYPKFELPGALPAAKTARQQTLEDRSAAPVAAAAKAAARASAATDTAGAPGTRRTRRKANATVNTNDYVFEEDEPVRPVARAAARRPVNKVLPEVPQVTGPYRYDTRFMADNITTSLKWDPLLGIGLQFRAHLNDLLENQRIDAGLFGLFDLRTSNINASYTNLTHRVDWTIAYQKQAYFFDLQDGSRFRYGRHEAAVTFAYPLTHNLSLRAGPRYENLNRTLSNSFSNALDNNQNYVGYKAELVFDNSIATGVNMLRGTRMKVALQQLQGINNAALNFGKLTVDLRHYQKVHRSIIWANRASYGQFFGPNPQFFRLGGMDNWFFPNYKDDRVLFQPNVPVPDPSQIFNQQFVTNLRGFDYSTRTGSRYLLFNSELRVPIVQYLSRRPIYSAFLRNLQFTGFVDAGTAYSGGNPLSVDNSNNTVPFGGNGNPFSGTVTNFSNPLLVGYGVGVRTTLFGFYGKGDVAWGRENYTTNPPKFYFTLGYDF